MPSSPVSPTLYHSLLSPLINLGLLAPLEVCRAAEERYREKRARLNSVEGLIRQIIGWREFVYQVYHLKMPDYMESNFFGADLPLPEFYWSGESGMHCVADAIGTLHGHGINHHIQRLMVTGNFALIAGMSPQEVNRWYELAYVDAYEWVVSPNVLGMALYADGGLLATKPYAASANYINKMSDCCDRLHIRSAQDDGRTRMSIQLALLGLSSQKSQAVPEKSAHEFGHVARVEKKTGGSPRHTKAGYKASVNTG